MSCGDFRPTDKTDMTIFDSALSRSILRAFLRALIAFPLVSTSYWLDVANRVGIAVIAATGLNVLTGFTGQISLGNAAFLSVGAYSTAALTARGVPFLIAVPSSGLISAIIGMVFGFPSLRLKALYL